MSLRPMIFAADLAPLLTIADSLDTSMAERVGDKFWSRLTHRQNWTQEQARNEAISLFSGALRDKPESDEHVCMVVYLAGMLGIGATKSTVADGNWKFRGWSHYAEDVLPRLEKQPQALLSYLFGRPLFGSEIQSSWPYYGYLLGSEVDELLEAIMALREWPRLTDLGPDFHEELILWLQEVRKRNSDLWLYAD